MANVKISELAVNSSPSASTTLVGVDNGETVQIPITEFVTIDDNGIVKIREGSKVTFYNKDESDYCVLECEEDGTLSLNGNTVATKDDIPDTSNFVTKDENGNVTVETLQADDGIKCVGTLDVKEGYIARFWSDDNSKKVALRCDDNGKLTLDDKEVATVDDIPSDGSPMTSITYAELRALRDAGNLIPGMFYRITDYECTTAQENTRAMNHRFYIIVQALSHDTLSETAKADLVTDGTDDYFVDEGANVSAWEIKYCLDNDTTRFAWALDGQAITNLESMHSNGQPLVRQPSADGLGYGEYQYAWGTKADADDGDNTNFWYSKNEVITDCETVWSEGEEQIARVIEGKGVIYYMKDEHGNECPYDFKNIQFKRVITLDNGYPEYDPQGGHHTQETWVYTFCGNSYHLDNDEWSELKDGSLESPYMHQSDEHTYTFCNNTMKPYYMIYDEENDDTTKCGKQYLNNNVFFGYWEEIDSTDPENYPFYYAYACAFIEIGYECQNITFGYGCRHIAIGNKCNDNIFKPYCNIIKLGNHCRRNNINGACITLDDMCEGNVLWGDSLILLKNVNFIEHNDFVFNKIYKGYFEIV